MRWKIVDSENSPFAQRLNRMFGIPLSGSPDNADEALFLFRMSPRNIGLGQRDGRPKICYWTGSDAKQYLEKGARESFSNAIHASDSPMLIPKLAAKMSIACFLPLPPHLPRVDIPVEKDPGILMYLPQSPTQDIERSKLLIREIKDVPIHVVYGKGKRTIDGTFQPNIVQTDWIEDDAREELFKRVSVLVRLMNYDGLSQIVVEMKMLGRHVLYTEPTPYCSLVAPRDTPKDIADMVRKKLNAPLDTTGANWYRSVFSRENFLKIVKELCSLRGWDFPYGIVK